MCWWILQSDWTLFFIIHFLVTLCNVFNTFCKSIKNMIPLVYKIKELKPFHKTCPDAFKQTTKKFCLMPKLCNFVDSRTNWKRLSRTMKVNQTLKVIILSWNQLDKGCVFILVHLHKSFDFSWTNKRTGSMN